MPTITSLIFWAQAIVAALEPPTKGKDSRGGKKKSCVIL